MFKKYEDVQVGEKFDVLMYDPNDKIFIPRRLKGYKLEDGENVYKKLGKNRWVKKEKFVVKKKDGWYEAEICTGIGRFGAGTKKEYLVVTPIIYNISDKKINLKKEYPELFKKRI